MRIEHVRTGDIVRFQLVDGGRHLVTFDSLADLQAFAELVTAAVEMAEYARDVDAARIARGEGLHSADGVIEGG